jgi:hypothetical protein
MPERDNKFHEFAIRSILFKGHTDLYFCYLKAEKIAHVLSLLQTRSASDTAISMNSVVSAASRLPETILHFAAGEMDMTTVLADIFGLLSAMRLSVTQQFVSKENAGVLLAEYELLAEKIAAGSRLSPFISHEEFTLPPLPSSEESRSLMAPRTSVGGLGSIKDNKGQKDNEKDIVKNGEESKGHSRRTTAILELVRKHKSLSIRDIAKVIKGCSEKTIQRELALLISEGLLVKHGERRWSVYSPA